MRIALVLLAGGLVWADAAEDRAVDAFVKAQRKVERAAVEAAKAGAALEALCKERGQEVRVRANGLLGCVARPVEKVPEGK